MFEAASHSSRLEMTSMFIKFLFFFLFFKLTTSSGDNFAYDGFRYAKLTLDGIASITPNGLLQLTNSTQRMEGHAFHPFPLQFKSEAGKILSFNTTFVFSIQSDISDLSGQGLAFVISGTTNFSTAVGSQYLNLFSPDNNGNSSNHIFAVELDTIQNPEFQDINDNHVGIDINSLKSIKSHTAGYYEDSTGLFKNLSLISGQQMQLWVDFDAEDMQISVTLSPLLMAKPNRPLLSSTVDLSSLILDKMYVGFSSSPGPFRTSHYIHGWSFIHMPTAALPNHVYVPPSVETKSNSKSLVKWLPVVSCLLVLIVAATALVLFRRKKYAELLEDWELEYGPHRFAYKDLFQATKGFKEEELMGKGGFGRVYRGVLPNSNMEIAVKKVSHESRQGMKEFVAEIVSIGRLRHRNLVQLLGYCRRKGELLLVYDLMPNGSLDKYLYDRTKPILNWDQRFQIIRGVAAGLLYLHEEWEKLVVHRDIKASNVLLDSEMNGRLGDFGLAKLCDRGIEPQTTHIVGTMGYIAPELARTGKATTATDVFAFGAFLLEVACGRRPIKHHAQEEELVLVDWVLANWKQGLVLETRDQELGEEYCAHEVELVLKLGLLCSHPMPAARPSMRQVMQILDGDSALPELSPCYLSYSSLLLSQNDDTNINSLTIVEICLDFNVGGKLGKRQEDGRPPNGRTVDRRSTVPWQTETLASGKSQNGRPVDRPVDRPEKFWGLFRI